MFIKAGATEYELSTKLGVSLKIEKNFRLPLTQVFDKISVAEIDELIKILAIAADKVQDNSFKEQILQNWDYTDLQYTVQELLSKLMFTGTPEEIEEKVNKFPVGETQKNAIRGMLGIPLVSSEQPIESA